MNYDNLDINQKINLKGLVQAWLNITVERFGEDLDAKLYNRTRSTRKKLLVRTRALRSNWRSTISSGASDVNGAQISFLEYGRMVDMGVGRGTSYALSKYQAIRKNGEPRTRKPVRWYSRRKGHEMHRLRELLTKYHIDVSLDALENALTTRVEMIA